MRGKAGEGAVDCLDCHYRRQRMRGSGTSALVTAPKSQDFKSPGERPGPVIQLRGKNDMISNLAWNAEEELEEPGTGSSDGEVRPVQCTTDSRRVGGSGGNVECQMCILCVYSEGVHITAGRPSSRRFESFGSRICPRYPSAYGHTGKILDLCYI